VASPWFDRPLEGRLVLVTGGARRIGRHIALHLSKLGARVLIHYWTSAEEARQTAAECNAAGLYQANLERVADIREMFGRIERDFGSLYGLVNNAGRFGTADPLELTEADWDAIHDVNLKAVFFCCQHAARLMKRAGEGRIVNISSLGGLQAWPRHVHYCASKAGVIMLTRALAKAFAPEITVNSVAPGVISFGELDEIGERLVRRTPAGRAGTAEEVADAVAYFLTASNYITGQVLAVDGGLSLR